MQSNRMLQSYRISSKSQNGNVALSAYPESCKLRDKEIYLQGKIIKD